MIRKIHILKADLHGHTVNSDGELTVLEIIDEAKKKGLDYYAITDHDTLKGADMANELMKNNDLGIKIVYGIELSTVSLDESVHILGYFKDKIDDDAPLRKTLEKQLENRKIRAQKIFDLLEQHFNIKLNRDEIYKYNSITRGNIAKMIIDAGYNYTHSQIFKEMIGDNCPCYIPSVKLSTIEGIKAIHENGGIAVLAHPCLLKKNNINDIIKLGIDGIEAIYPKTFNKETKYRDLAKKHNLFITAGSDFHRFKDEAHGTVGTCIIKGQDLDKFLNRLSQL